MKIKKQKKSEDIKKKNILSHYEPPFQIESQSKIKQERKMKNENKKKDGEKKLKRINVSK